jgi:hypothetical protein
MNKDQLRMQMLAGIITEGQYKAKLNEVTVGELPQHLSNELNKMIESGNNQLAIALDVADDDLLPEFKVENVDGKQFITGNNLLISDDEYVIKRQAEEMETGYDSMELNIPEVGETELYYIYDPNA